MLRRLDEEAHVWLAEADAPEVRARREAYLELLSAGERERYARFRVERGRREFLTGRALARDVLSRYAAVAPADWVLAPGPSGRPEIGGPGGVPDLRFNLAHAAGLVACLVTLGRPGGVDVEHPGRKIDLEALARRYFSDAERRTVLAAAGAARLDAFFSVWTLKEAYLKARGLGIALPLREISFRVEGRRIRPRFGEAIADDPALWQLDLLRTGSGHLLATALGPGAGPARRIVVQRIVPLDAAAEAAAAHALASSREP